MLHSWLAVYYSDTLLTTGEGTKEEELFTWCRQLWSEWHPWYRGFLCREQISSSFCFCRAIARWSDASDCQDLRQSRSIIFLVDLHHSLTLIDNLNRGVDQFTFQIRIDGTNEMMNGGAFFFAQALFEEIIQNEFYRLLPLVGHSPTGITIRSLARVVDSNFRRSIISSSNGTF